VFSFAFSSSGIITSQTLPPDEISRTETMSPPLLAQPPQRQRGDTQKRQLAPSVPVYLLLHDEADNGVIIDFEYERGESSSDFTVVLDFIKSENLKLCVAAGVEQPEPMKCSFVIPPGA
jgi:hypothetical protein